MRLNSVLLPGLAAVCTGSSTVYAFSLQAFAAPKALQLSATEVTFGDASERPLAVLAPFATASGSSGSNSLPAQCESDCTALVQAISGGQCSTADPTCVCNLLEDTNADACSSCLSDNGNDSDFAYSLEQVIELCDEATDSGALSGSASSVVASVTSVGAPSMTTSTSSATSSGSGNYGSLFPDACDDSCEPLAEGIASCSSATDVVCICSAVSQDGESCQACLQDNDADNTSFGSSLDQAIYQCNALSGAGTTSAGEVSFTPVSSDSSAAISTINSADSSAQTDEGNAAIMLAPVAGGALASIVAAAGIATLAAFLVVT